MSWRVWLLMLAALAVFAAAWRRCSHRLLVGDFPIVEQSSRGLVLATLPHVVALVAPLARVRRRASRGKRQGLSRALRQSRGWAWCPAPRCPQRYGSTPQPWRAPAPTARARFESHAVEPQRPRNAARQTVVSALSAARKPGMQATAREHGRFFRRYRAGERVAQLPRETLFFRRKHAQLWNRESTPLHGVRFSVGQQNQKRQDFFDHGPRHPVTRRWPPAPIEEIYLAVWCYIAIIGNIR